MVPMRNEARINSPRFIKTEQNFPPIRRQDVVRIDTFYASIYLFYLIKVTTVLLNINSINLLLPLSSSSY